MNVQTLTQEEIDEIRKRNCQACKNRFDNPDNYIDKTDPLYFRKYGWTKEYHKTCWDKVEKQQAENERICREKQAQIIANFQANSRDAFIIIMEIIVKLWLDNVSSFMYL